MKVVNAEQGLVVMADGKCGKCTIEQQIACLKKVSVALVITNFELTLMDFRPEQLGNGKAIEIDCQKEEKNGSNELSSLHQ